MLTLISRRSSRLARQNAWLLGVLCALGTARGALAQPSAQSTCTVDRLSGSYVGDGQGLRGDLRYCLTQANSGSSDTVVFDVTGTISLRFSLGASHDVAIVGPGSGHLTVRPGDASGFTIFDVARGATVSLSGLTLAGSHGGELSTKAP